MEKLLTVLTVILAINIGIAQGTVFPNEGTTMTLGTGYNSLTGRDLDRCIIGETVTTLAGGHGSETFVTFEEIKTRTQLNRILGLNASASLGIGGFSGSSKVSFANNYDFNSSTYYLAIRIIVRNQSEVLKQYKLSQEAKDLLSSNKEHFLQVCGDAFIAARVTGGEFLAIVKLETSNSTEKNSLSASFKSKFTSFSGGGSGYKEITQIFENHNGSIDVVRRGGHSALPQFWDPASLKNYTAQFPKEVSAQNGAPIVYSITTKPYSELLDAISFDVISLTNSRVVLEDLAKTHTKAISLHDNIGYITSNPGEFINPNIESLLSADLQIVETINRIREHASVCEQFPADPTKCKILTVEELQLPKVKLPNRIKGKYKLMRSAACGIESYETKRIPKSCRSIENGREIVETRKLQWRDQGQHLTKYAHHQPKELDKACNDCRDRDSHPKPWENFDKNWEIISTKGLSYGSNDYDASSVWISCETIIARYQYKLAPHPSCGYDEVIDYEKPIFKECRHESHGYEE